MFNTGKGFLALYERIARVLTTRFNISVKPSQGGTYTDGKNIFLDMKSGDFTKEAKTLFDGQNDHEIGHLLFSKFSMDNFEKKELMQAIKNKKVLNRDYTNYLKEIYNTKVFGIWNHLEDVRVNRKMVIFPGCVENIDEAVIIFLTKLKLEERSKEGNINLDLLDRILVAIRLKNNIDARYEKDYKSMYDDFFSGDVIVKNFMKSCYYPLGLHKKIFDMKSTEDTCDLTKEIYKIYLDFIKQQQQQTNQNQQNQNKEQQNGTQESSQQSQKQSKESSHSEKTSQGRNETGSSSNRSEQETGAKKDARKSSGSESSDGGKGRTKSSKVETDGKENSGKGSKTGSESKERKGNEKSSKAQSPSSQESGEAESKTERKESGQRSERDEERKERKESVSEEPSGGVQSSNNHYDAKTLQELIDATNEGDKKSKKDFWDKMKKILAIERIENVGDNRDDVYTPVSTEVIKDDSITNLRDKLLKNNSFNKTEYKALVKSLNSELAEMSRNFMQKFYSKTLDTTFQTDEKDNPFNALEIAKTFSFENYEAHYPYIKTIEGEKRSIAIQILVDLSGSMISKTAQSRDICITLAETFKRLNISFEVCGHHTKNRFNDGGFAGRKHSVEFIVIKDFNDSNLENLVWIPQLTANNNADGLAMEIAGTRLLNRTEDRKVMFYICDGEPTGYTSKEAGKKHMQDVVKEFEKFKMEFYCIGLGVNVTDIFGNKKAFCVNSTKSLAKDLLKIITNKL